MMKIFPRSTFPVALMLLLGNSRVMSQEQPAHKSEAETQDLAAQLPEGEGKPIFVKGCTTCHSLSQIVASRKTAKAWARTVDEMITRGSSVRPEQVDTLVKYLAANLGPALNINRAGAAELASLPSLDSKLASNIINYREKNGPFLKVEDLTKVEGLSDEILQKLKNRITVGSKDTTGEKEKEKEKEKDKQ
jgi:competence ComEA-like helix-hairpin-helix protein